jgi:hypothetical protein
MLFPVRRLDAPDRRSTPRSAWRTAEGGGTQRGRAVSGGAATRLPTHRILAATLATFLATVTACGETPAPPADAGARDDAAAVLEADLGVTDAEPAPDADPPDLGAPDLGAFDLGAAFRAEACLTCSSCLEGTCVTSGRRRFCADGCRDAVDGCLGGFTCLDLAPDAGGLPVCVPPQGVCDPATTGLGTVCWQSTDTCYRERSACQGDGLALGYCTDLCGGDEDCAPGWRCALGDDGSDVCVPTFTAPAEQCARDGTPGESACAFDGDCAPGARCVGAAHGRVGVCAEACGAGDACADDARCLDVGGGERRCLSQRCACRGTSLEGPSLLDDALDGVGLDRCAAIIPLAALVAAPNDMLADPYRLPGYDARLTEPWRATPWASAQATSLGRAVDAAPSALAAARAALRTAAAPLGLAIVPTPSTPPAPVDPLAGALADLIRAAGGAPDLGALRAASASLDAAQQQAVAIAVEGLTRGVEARALAFDDLSADALRALYDYGPAFLLERRDGFGLDPTQANTRRIFTELVDYAALAAGADAILEGLESADLAQLAAPSTSTITTAPTMLLAVDTPVGRVLVGGAGPSRYDADTFAAPIALLVELGGDDLYEIPVGANTSATHGVAVLVDLGGDDTYGYPIVPDANDLGGRLPSDADGRRRPANAEQRAVSLSEVARFGAGRAGLGVLVDLGGGRDRYTSLRFTQGAGVFGVGLLVDDAGDDAYRAEAFAQGAGAFGLGLLVDRAGRDTHQAWAYAQGFGFALGAGLALDVDGDDAWTLDVGDPAQGGDPLYPSAQRPNTSNASLGQGCGFGRRADFSDRAFMSGGVGMLVDLAGADRYRASVFAQGCGFWFGTGILADRGGDDRYDGLWYAGGAGAHYAQGFLLEGGGDDRYGAELAGLNVTYGGGHDFSFAALVDDAGDDLYQGSRITLGSGNANGRGLLVDNAGDDRYATASGYGNGAAGLLDVELARPGSPRRSVDTLGVFIDAAGRDTYAVAGMTPTDARDGATWRRSMTTADPPVQAVERGVGLDVPAGRSGVRAW